MHTGTSLSFDEVMKRARERQLEFEKLPQEEQDRLLAEREEILKQLRGTPGFMEISVPLTDL